MMPEPMPVATLTKRKWSTGPGVLRSPRAMMLTSLSTQDGTSDVLVTHPGTSKPSHPGMIGGLTGRPVLNCDGAGQPDADRRSGRRGCGRAVEQGVAPGPAGTAPARGPRRCRLRFGRWRARAHQVGEGEVGVAGAEVGREHDAGEGRSATREGGRPPVEAASATGPTRPRSARASRRRPMVERASTGHRREFGPGARQTVAEELEELACPGGRGRTSASCRNGGSKPQPRARIEKNFVEIDADFCLRVDKSGLVVSTIGHEIDPQHHSTRRQPVTTPLSVQLYTVRDAIAADLPGTLKRLADIGYTQVEPFRSSNASTSTPRPFRPTA